MLLKSVRLNNIRSYVAQEVKFPSGKILLSGDIGSGKSTILLAIEFALFGILPGELSGNALLRNGEQKGSIELNFEINKQDITIGRTLKRSKESVGQGSGFIVRNGMKKEMTPVELKTEVFNLLGYPRELVSKGKNIIYRYTVYTPQEEMKRILQEDAASRLDILRKVFGIDKYKRIQDNTAAYAKTLREKCREKAGMISDLEEKRRNRTLREKEFAQAEELIKQIKPKLDGAREKVAHKKNMMAANEQKQKEMQEIKKKIAVKETEIFTKTEQQKRNEKQMPEIEKQITELRKEIDGKETKEIKIDEISERNRKLMLIEKEIRENLLKKAEYDTDNRRSTELKQKISKLDNCPTCLQTVDKTHKQMITDAEDEKIQKNMLFIAKYDTAVKEKEEEGKQIKKEIEELRTKEKEQALLRLKKNSLADKEKQYSQLQEQQETLQKAAKEADNEKNRLGHLLDEYSCVEHEYLTQKKELEFLMLQERDIDIEYNRAAERKKNMQSVIAELDTEIERKENVKKELLRLNEITEWLQEYFVKLVETIEKQVMTRVFYEFNELFQKWFGVLVEDETIQSRLDDTFTPIIVQNGYDIEIENLSGGEKTACALAYRLALNKVINDLITGINTKELLILDEPTDGFSSEQLDKMRDVLEQLNIAQVIIVSHESKIETFVDEVIRVAKNEHISAASCE